jgi:hypothetical protein
MLAQALGRNLSPLYKPIYKNVLVAIGGFLDFCDLI